MSPKDIDRAINNYFQSKTQGNYSYEEVEKIKGFLEFTASQSEKKKFKVGLMFICINFPYWQYAQNVIDGARKYFLPGHDTEIMLWSDIPNYDIGKDVNYGTTMFPVDSVQWPYPTLLRYHLLLNQEEYLKKFDYIFFCDLDMEFVNIVGDEILGEGITAALHPMYAVRRELIFPLEPNPNSAAYIKIPPYYYAGGFQGGKTEAFINAMKEMKRTIDFDFNRNYIARWNDESHWNKYLFDNAPSIVLSPGYVYPDSLIDKYYRPIWGTDYPTKLITKTKQFTVNKEGGEALKKMLENPL